MALGEWDTAAQCVLWLRSADPGTTELQARALYCDGAVRNHFVDPSVSRAEATEERLSCAAAMIAGLSIAIEEWPRTAEVVMAGLDSLWPVLEVLYRQGHYRSILDALAFVVTLHERLMIGGPYTHVQWTARYAACLRCLRRTGEALVQWNAVLDTAVRLRDERLQVQALRAIAAMAGERADIAAANPASKTAKGDSFVPPKTPHGLAIYTSQLFLSGHFAAAGETGLDGVRTDLKAVFDAIESPGGGTPAPAAAPHGRTSTVTAAAGGPRSGTSGGGRAARQAQQQSAHSSSAGLSTGAGPEQELTDPQILEEVASNVVLCMSMAGGDATAPGSKFAAALERMVRSSNMRVRSFGLYAAAFRRQGGSFAEELRRLPWASDRSYVTDAVRDACLLCLQDIEAGMFCCKGIADPAERDYATQIGCSLVWAAVLPLLTAPGKRKQLPKQIRQALNHVSNELSDCGASMPALRAAVEYESSLLELDADNITVARSRILSALHMLPASGSTTVPAAPTQAPRSSSQPPPQRASALSGPATGTPAPLSDEQRVGANHHHAGLESPMDFPLAWLRHRIDIRATADPSLLTEAGDQALRCIEQAMTTAAQAKRVVLLKSAFSRLPPLVQAVAKAPVAAIPVLPAAPVEQQQQQQQRRSASARSRQSSQRPSVTGSVSAAVFLAAAPPEALPDRNVVQLYGALLDECRAVVPMPDALGPLATAVAETLLAVPLPVQQFGSPVEPGARRPSNAAIALASIQAEAALFLCERADGETAGDPLTRSEEYALQAAQLGWHLTAHREPGRWLCLSACQDVLNLHASRFERGSFRAAAPILERLYPLFHGMAIDREVEGRLTVDMGLSLALAHIEEHIRGKSSDDAGLDSVRSFEGLLRNVLAYAKPDHGSALLKRAQQVVHQTLECVSDPAYKAHLYMLAPLLQRLTAGTGAGEGMSAAGGVHANGGGTNGTSSRPMGAQDQLLLLLGRLASGAKSADDKARLVVGEGMQLLRAGPPTVQLCGRLAVVARQLGLESTLLEIFDVAALLYKSGRLGWCTAAEPIAAEPGVGGPSPTGNIAPASAAAADAGGGVTERENIARAPTPVDWYWYATLLHAEAALYFGRCARVESDAVVRLALQVLTLCTNVAIASTRSPASARGELFADAFGLYYATLAVVIRHPQQWPACLPSLRMLLGRHVLEPALAALDTPIGGKRAAGPSAAAALGAVAAEEVHQLVFNLGVAMFHCLMHRDGPGGSAGSRHSSSVSTCVAGDDGASLAEQTPELALAALQDATSSLSFLRSSLPTKWQRQFATVEAGYLGRLGLPRDLLAQRLKGRDADTEALAWSARARTIGRTRELAVEAWSCALAAGAAQPATPLTRPHFTQARAMFEMCQHLAANGWLALGEALELLHTALELIEHVPRLAERAAAEASRAGGPAPFNRSLGFASSTVVHPAADEADTATPPRPRPPSAGGESARAAAGPDLFFGELALAFAVSQMLFSLAPHHQQQQAATPTRGAQPLRGRAEYALFMVHYVECMWSLAIGKSNAGQAEAPAGLLSVADLPPSAASWFGFSFGQVDVDGVIQAGVLELRYNTPGLHGTLLRLASYLSTEPGLEQYTFIVAAWCQLVTAVRAATLKDTVGATCARRAANLFAYRAASRCGVGAAGHIYNVAEADASHYSAVREALVSLGSSSDGSELPFDLAGAEAITAAAAAFASTPGGGSAVKVGHPAVTTVRSWRSLALDGGAPELIVSAHMSGLCGVLLAEAKCLDALGRCAEAGVLVDMVRAAAVRCGDHSSVFACDLHGLRSLRVARGRRCCGALLEAAAEMRRAVSAAGGDVSGKAAAIAAMRAEPDDVVEWLCLKCTTLVELRGWRELSATLAALSVDPVGSDAPLALLSAPVSAAVRRCFEQHARESALRASLAALVAQLSASAAGSVDREALRMATICMRLLAGSDAPGAHGPPTLLSRFELLSASISLRGMHDDDAGGPPVGGALLRQHPEAYTAARALVVLKRDADAIEGLLVELRHWCVVSSVPHATNPSGAAGRSAAIAHVASAPPRVSADAQLRSSLASMESVLLQWRAECAQERLHRAETIQRVYQSLTLPELGLPLGDGPQQLERVVADYMRNPLKSRGLSAGGGEVEEGRRVAREWEQPNLEFPTELVNAFGHFSVPVELLDGAGRCAARIAAFAAVDLASINGVPTRGPAALALVRLEYHRAMELHCGLAGERWHAYMRELWARHPARPIDRTATGGPGSHRKSKAPHAERKGATGQKEAEPPSPVLGPQYELSEEERFLLSCARAALYDATGRFDYAEAYECLALMANLLILWGCPEEAALAVEMAVAARLATEVVRRFADLSADTAEAVLWRQFQALARGAYSAGPLHYCSSSVEVLRARCELLAASPMLTRLDQAIASGLLAPPGDTATAPVDAAASAPLMGRDTSNAAAKSGNAGQVAQDTHVRYSAASCLIFPLELPDAAACVSVCLACPVIPAGAQQPSPNHDFLVVLHHPDGSTDSRLVPIPCEALAALKGEYRVMLVARRDEIVAAAEAAQTQKVSSDASSKHAARAAATPTAQAALAVLLDAFLARQDEVLTAPLLAEFIEAIAAYSVKQPLLLCLDPLLQPLPIEHGLLLSTQTSCVTRELSVFTFVTDTYSTGAPGRSTTKGSGSPSATLFVIDPLGDHPLSVDVILGSDSSKNRNATATTAADTSKYRGCAGGPTTTAVWPSIITASGEGMPAAEASIAHSLQLPGFSFVVVNSCGSLSRIVRPRTICNSALSHVQSMLLATGGVSLASSRREAKERVSLPPEELVDMLMDLDDDCSASPSAEWVVPLLLLARGVRALSSVWYPMAASDNDVLCKRSLPGLASGKGFADAAPLAARLLVSPATKAPAAAKAPPPPRRLIAVHYGVKPHVASKPK